MKTDNKESQVSFARARLTAKILTGEYKDKLPIQLQLVKDLGVSRTVLRDALRMMQYLNMLTTNTKDGTRIKPQSEWLILVPKNHYNFNQEVHDVLNSFMGIYSIYGWDGDPAYILASEILETMNKVKGSDLE